MKKLQRSRFTDVEQLKRFSPSRLAEFLRPFADKLNLKLPQIPNDENMPYGAIRKACFRFDDDMPGEFLVATHLISSIATPRQRQRLMDLAEKKRIPLNIPADVSDHDFALLAWQENPDLVEMTLAQSIMLRQRRYSYYPNAKRFESAVTPSASAIKSACRELDDVFGIKGYGIGANIMVEDSPEEIWFLIRRGEHIARVAAVADDGSSEIHVLRPENYDVVVLNKRHGFLKVLLKPDNQGLHPHYRGIFGRLLFGHSEAFHSRDCFHVEMFKTADSSLLSSDGLTDLRFATLVSVQYDLPGAGKRSRRFTSPDIFLDLQPGELAIPKHATPKDVTIRFEFSDDRKHIDAKIFAGTTATFSRDGAAYLIDEWLIALNILRLSEASEREKAA